ncbi:MAG: rhodanese-like domain-containing protein [Bacteroidota bacterium]|jgi:rhodanese-related sulfurtransferase|nr:rhodanese-like domain-containing protein [Bacteroidia bacterium]MDP1746112.1 rhodanese-like domain-containing protein [Bacteroidota bacterium]
MSKIITFIIVAISGLTLAQCNSQSKKTDTMKNPIETKTDLKQIIVDVRTPEEWQGDGHADCSVNYPLDSFDSKIEELKKYDKVVIVCRSGARAGVAKSKLLGAGYTKEVENLGAWQNIACNK